MKRALITGITGQDGSYLAELRAQAAGGYETTAMRSTNSCCCRMKNSWLDRSRSLPARRMASAGRLCCASRSAQAYGIESKLPDFYRIRTLLTTDVTADDVAEAALFLAGPRSATTTGAMLPVGAGVKEALPR